MKKIIIYVLLVMFSGCTTLNELASFSKCEFKMKSLENSMLAGINVSGITKLSDLGFTDAAKLGIAFANKNIPLSFTLNIDSRNPNKTKAAISSIEWIAFIDGTQMVAGTLNQRIEVPPDQGVATIPLDIRVNLFDVINKESKDALLNFGLNLADKSNQPTRVTLKIKPTIMIGAFAFQYPGYFNVTKEFGGK